MHNDWMQRLIEILQRLPGFMGIIEYGSRARDDTLADADLDLVVILEQPVDVNRLHAGTTDLNLMTLADLTNLTERIEKSDQHPWDTMLLDVRIILDPSGQLESAVQRLQQAFARGETLSQSETDGLRFLTARLIRDVQRYKDDDLTSRLLAYRTLIVLIVARHWLNGLWWQGIKRAVRELQRSDPSLYNLATQCIVTPSAKERASILLEMCEKVFELFGGSWEGEPLILASDLPLDNSAERLPVSAEVWQELLLHLEKQTSALP